ncbi:50S ribosomal protein L25 [candidate division KSB1 bacterium]
MADVKLEAVLSKREHKSDIRMIRESGKVPGVYYIEGKEAISLEVDYKALQAILSSDHSLINLNVQGGEDQLCIFREVQVDPVTSKLVHFDLLGIEKGKELELNVPIELIGTPEGVRTGGMIEHPNKEVRIKCLPRHIPDKIEIDVTKLQMGDAVYVKDLDVENVVFIESPDKLIAHVITIKVVEEVVEEEEEEEVAEGEEAEEKEVEEAKDKEGEEEESK